MITHQFVYDWLKRGAMRRGWGLTGVSAPRAAEAWHYYYDTNVCT